MIAGSAQRATGLRLPRLVEALDLVLLWIERTRQRTQLASIDRSLLRDLGLSEVDLDAECRKHFWQ